MRYACPSCNRVFYLDTKTSSPCPACGTMLQVEEEGAAAAGPSDVPEAEVVGADGGAWAPEEDAPASADALPWESGAEQPAASEVPWDAPGGGAAPSAATWFATPAERAALGPEPSVEGPEDDTLQMPGGPVPQAGAGTAPASPVSLEGFGAEPPASEAATAAYQGFGPEEAGVTEALPQGGLAGGPAEAETVPPPLEGFGADLAPAGGVAPGDMTVAGPAGAVGTGAWEQPTTVPGAPPSGSHVFLITSLVFLVLLGAAVGAMYLLGGPAKLFTQTTGDKKATSAEAEKKIAALNEQIQGVQEKLKEEQQKALEAREGRQAAELELEKQKNKAGELEAGLARRADAAALALEALALLERRSDLAAALRATDKAISLDQGLLVARRVRGRVLLGLGRAEEAVATFTGTDRAARAAGAPGDAEGLLLAGEACLSDMGDTKRAAEHYRAAAELDPKGAFGLVAAARALQLEGKLSEAAAKADEARKLPHPPAAALLVRGEIAVGLALKVPVTERKAALEEADRLLARALRLDPNSARACLMRGRLLIRQAELSGSSGFSLVRLDPQMRAERLLAMATRLKPGSSEAHLALAELRLRKGALRDPPVARTLASEAVRLTKRKSAPALAVLADTHAATGDPEGAVRTIKEAIQLSPDNGVYVEALRRYEKDARELRR